MNNIEKMDEFLKSYSLPRPNQNERQNMNSPNASHETESVI